MATRQKTIGRIQHTTHPTNHFSKRHPMQVEIIIILIFIHTRNGVVEK